MNNSINTTNTTNIYGHIAQCAYNPGMSEFSFQSVLFLSSDKCLQVYGTDRVVLLEDVVLRVTEEAERLRAIECPSHLYCGADDAWYESMNCDIEVCYTLIEDLQKGEKDLTITQAGVLYRLFPELQKGIVVEAARREIQYSIMHRYYCDVMDMDTNLSSAERVIKDLKFVDDQRSMEDGIPQTDEQYAALEVGEHVSYNRSKDAYENLSRATENLFRWHVKRDDHRNWAC